eukprot:COSAG01_NODE_11357_length_1952_cov_1.785753_2_plen_229_part_00
MQTPGSHPLDLLRQLLRRGLRRRGGGAAGGAAPLRPPPRAPPSMSDRLPGLTIGRNPPRGAGLRRTLSLHRLWGLRRPGRALPLPPPPRLACPVRLTRLPWPGLRRRRRQLPRRLHRLRTLRLGLRRIERPALGLERRRARLCLQRLQRWATMPPQPPSPQPRARYELTEISLRFHMCAIPLSPPAPAALRVGWRSGTTHAATGGRGSRRSRAPSRGGEQPRGGGERR